MSVGELVQTPDRATAVPPRTFNCAEIWGGNRPIDSPITLPGVRGHIFSQPCDGGRGGDIHYISICGSGLLSRMCLADVAGHGEAVGRVSDEIHGLLRRYMNNHDQRRVLVDLNRRLTTGGLGPMTTAIAITYFPTTRALSVSYAGHPPPWLYSRAEERWIRLDLDRPGKPEQGAIDLPLAVDAATEFSRRQQRVAPGDRLLAVTDGVLEARSPAGDLFGEARLEATLRAERQASVDELSHAVVAAVRAFAGGNGLRHDDVTVLTVEFLRGPRIGGSLWLVLRNRLLRRRASAPYPAH